MSESSSIEVNGGQLQDFTIDQFAGATALILGSFGGLLMIIWKSRCACKVRLGMTDNCVCFECSRTPPPDDIESDEESKDPVSNANQRSKTKDKNKKKKKPNIQLIPKDLSTKGELPETTTDNQEEEDLENIVNRNNP